jgi:preprotein translocase subunit SecG
METLQTLLLVIQVLVSVALILFILVQHGKGADAGAAFGSGASSTVFGARGSGNFLSRTTSVLALVFLVNSLVLAYIATQRLNSSQDLITGGQKSVLDQSKQQKPATPATGAPATPTKSGTPEAPKQ